MSSSRQLVERLEKAEVQRNTRLNPMTVIGKEEIMLRWSKQQIAILIPGDKIMTDLYEEALEADPCMVLRDGDSFEYEGVDEHGRKIKYWVTCYLNEHGLARYSRDDETKKNTRERYQTEAAEIAKLKDTYGFDGVAINKLRAASRVGLLLSPVVWLENALKMQGEADVVRNLLATLFKGAENFPEKEFRSILNHIGFEPPVETGRDFVSVCFGVRALLVNIDFGKKVVEPETNGHAKINGNGYHNPSEDGPAIGPEHAKRAAGISETFAPVVQ